MADAPKIVITGQNKDTLRTGAEKINSAIENANEALKKSSAAETNSSSAISTADEANRKADSVQTQFNQVVIEGDSSVEAAQARVNSYGNSSNTLKDRLDASEKRLEDLGYNIRWNALLALNGDWTNAIQTALDNYTHVYIPSGTFKYTSLTIKKFGAVISGSGHLYGGSTLEYSGAGTSIQVLDTVNYLTVKNLQIKGIPAVSTDFYNTGSLAIDITAGNTSIVCDSVFFTGFETLVKANYNGFYNKFINCRFDRFKNGIHQFSVNNLEVKGCRFVRFNNAMTVNGAGGPLTISKSSFEVFNGYIVGTSGVEKGLVIFKDNYVEIYDSENLPTNFPQATNALAGKFGGNILFTGPIGTLILKDNELQIGGVFRVVSLSDCDHLESTGNLIHLYQTGNNLNNLYSCATPLRYVNIQDRLGKSIGATGPYSRTYSTSASTLYTSKPYDNYKHYDAVLDKEFFNPKKVYGPSLLNGWVPGDVNSGPPKIIFEKEGLYLQGLVTGTNRTGVVILNLPVENRPFEIGTSRAYCNLGTASDEGSGNQVRLRYLYASGDLRLEGTPASTNLITLDGLFIPARI